MSTTLIISVIVLYFLLLIAIAQLTSRKAGNDAFFIGERKSPWYIVAFGMIGASLSGVTFISVPGWVEGSQFSYMQMVLGYLPGYMVIAFVLMPIYYRLQLTSIYGYLGERFGRSSYLTGAGFFLLSRSLGAAARLYLVAMVLQYTLFDRIGVPFIVTVCTAILLIWLYTNKGGIKTIIWTDTLQTLFMLMAVLVTVILVGKEMGWGIGEIIDQVRASDYSKTFFFDDSNSKLYFWKRFLAGMFVAIAMTGLDQDMMQKNLSCRNIKEAQKNMVSFSVVLVFVNLVFLSLGALLFIYADETGFLKPERSDDLFGAIATEGGLPVYVGVLFFLGLIAAAYSSADSALTSLTTSVCVDLVEIEKKPEQDRSRIRRRVHVMMSVVLVMIIMVYRAYNDRSVIDLVFTIAGYTYGPLLGLFAYGMLTKRRAVDRLIPLVAIAAPLITYLISANSKAWFNGYEFGFELLLLNGAITFFGIWLTSNLSHAPASK
jgi:SSS family transporter